MDKVIYKPKERRYTEDVKGKRVDTFFNGILVKILLLGISIFLFYNIGHSVMLTIQKIDILRKAQREVENLRLKNLELATLLDSMQSVEYLEVEARDRLSFSAKKDFVFVIPESLLSMASNHLEKIVDENYVEETEYGFKVWKDFILSGI
ncbi:MAG: septum formation initiator family protein [Candidatus Dojkabacteria bacterium]|nr:septum formation initiator family protein [Candidatus Dojkabacteria bacterium]